MVKTMGGRGGGEGDGGGREVWMNIHALLTPYRGNLYIQDTYFGPFSVMFDLHNKETSIFRTLISVTY